MAAPKEIISLVSLFLSSQRDSCWLLPYTGVLHRWGKSSGQLHATLTTQQEGGFPLTPTSGLHPQTNPYAHPAVGGGRQVGYAFRFPKSPCQGHIIYTFLRFMGVEEDLFPKGSSALQKQLRDVQR